MLQRIACLFFAHRPDKKRVRHDGEDYVAPCRACGRLMVKTRTGDRPWKLDKRQCAGPAAEHRRVPSRRTSR